MPSINEIQDLINHVILSRQDVDSGLFPASTAVSQHGDYRDAWVRDNLYTILSVWGLWIHFNREPGKTDQAKMYESSIRKNMRGLLKSMMKQSAKVERFKVTQDPLDALHAKYNTQSGDIVVADDKWGHLQVDATSLYILVIAQITQSGIYIIESDSEVNFIQNLVYYIGKGYQIPDFGIWERGNKINNGRREIHASSVGMVKAALQAIKVTNLLPGDSLGHVFVNEDEIARCRVTLEQLLPRESLSKEVDSANLSIIGFPAFAIENPIIINNTEEKITDKLTGNFGSKRFLLDGHQTAIEDPERLYYNDQEIRNFENIESEWPLFTVYQYLNALFKNDQEAIKQAREKITSLMLTIDGKQLIPELYFVEKNAIEFEKKNPGSQPRTANENVPLIWAQSLYYLAQLIDNGFISTNDVDPVGLHLNIGKTIKPEINVVFIVENEHVKSLLAEKNIVSQVYTDTGAVKILPSTEYAHIHESVGAESSLGLTGAPFKRPRTLATAKIYNIDGQPCVFIPGFQNRTSFYFASDYQFLVDKMRAELQLLEKHWQYQKSPFMVFLVTEEMLEPKSADSIYALGAELTSGQCQGINVDVCNFEKILETAGQEIIKTGMDYNFPEKFLPKRLNRHYWLPFNPENTKLLSQSVLSFLEPAMSPELMVSRILETDNIYEQLDFLVKLWVAKGADYPTGIGQNVTVTVLIEEIYRRACDHGLWNLIRKTAAILGKYWGSLEDSVSEILSRQKILVVGRSYNDIGLIKQPMNNLQILQLLKKNTGYDEREAIINQEIIVLLSILLKKQPESFSDSLTLRTGQFAQIIMSQLSNNLDGEAAESFDLICNLSPSELMQHIKRVVEHFENSSANQFANEALLLTKGAHHLNKTSYSGKKYQLGDTSDWYMWRDLHGLLPRLNDEFYQGLWQLLEKSHGIIVGNRFDSRTRMASEIVLNMVTSGESQFAHLFEVMISRIDSPSYRQMTVEAIQALIEYVQVNPEIKFQNYLIIEVILGHAVRLNWLEKETSDPGLYNQNKGKAWHHFYLETPERVAEMIQQSVNFLIETGLTEHDENDDGHAISPRS